MKKYFSYANIPDQGGTVVTLGNFDGFHLGHQEIVRHTCKAAESLGLNSLIITFHPHPRQLLAGELAVLTPLEQKVKLLAEAGADTLLVQPFTRAFAAIDPNVFLEEVLYTALHCRHLVVGYDYSFGKAGAGSTRLMKDVSQRLGMGCDIIEPVTHGQEVISSTSVRSYLSQGNVEMAAKFMGRPFTISGRVETGAGRGKDLGFPTANLYPAPSIALPALGVYMVKIFFGQEEHWGIANIGYHPTYPDNRLSLEVFVLEFSGNLYEQMVDVMFVNRLRQEIKFPDGESLCRQLEQDVNQVKALLSMDNMLKLQRI